MNELKIIEVNGQFVTDSREVAERVGFRHDNILSKIRGYIDVLDSSKLSSHNFFLSSSYINEQNKEQPCFLLTRKGCDMVANKMTGEKGILFTAEYVTEFEKMEKQIETFKTQKLLDKIEDFQKSIDEAKRQFKPSHSKKLQYNKLIKQLSFTNDEFIAIQTFVFAMLGVDKWENTAVEDGPRIMELINTSAVLISSKQFQQTKLY